MDIVLSNSSGEPIYQQIVTQIKGQIMSGQLMAGDALPSMRLLAQKLRISVITTKRAYDELEKDGFIYTIASKGCFIAPKNLELLREENLKRIEQCMEEINRLAKPCGLSKKEIIEMFDLFMEDES